jgi:uncharacterized Tic20 family protein
MTRDYHSDTDRTTYDPVGYLSLPVFTHLLGLVTWIFGPTLVYLLTDDEYTQRNAARAIQWGLTLVGLTVFVVGLFFTPLLLLTPVIERGWGLFAISYWGARAAVCTVLLFHAMVCLIGAVQAANGVLWKYPLTVSALEHPSEA